VHLVEKRGFFGWYKFVNTYTERDKKIRKNLIFALTPLRIWLIFRSSTGVSRRSKTFKNIQKYSKILRPPAQMIARSAGDRGQETEDRIKNCRLPKLTPGYAVASRFFGC